MTSTPSTRCPWAIWRCRRSRVASTPLLHSMAVTPSATDSAPSDVGAERVADVGHDERDGAAGAGSQVARGLVADEPEVDDRSLYALEQLWRDAVGPVQDAGTVPTDTFAARATSLMDSTGKRAVTISSWAGARWSGRGSDLVAEVQVGPARGGGANAQTVWARQPEGWPGPHLCSSPRRCTRRVGTSRRAQRGGLSETASRRDQRRTTTRAVAVESATLLLPR